MSEHRWIPRVVPILGPTDDHLAAVLASARASCGELVSIGNRDVTFPGRLRVSLFL